MSGLLDTIARIPPSQRYEVAEAIERLTSARTTSVQCACGKHTSVAAPGLTGPAARVVEALLDALRSP